jgi:RTX calcium-binding nonapeptide repeat (4 copies)
VVLVQKVDGVAQRGGSTVMSSTCVPSTGIHVGLADGVVMAAGNDTLVARGGNDTLFADNVNFAGSASVGTMGGRDLLDAGDRVDTLRAGPADDSLNGGPGSPDDCDGEAGIDTAKSCEILTGVP